MTDAEFLAFNEPWMAAVLPCLCDGGVFGTFIDWRGYPTVHSAAVKLGLKPLNLIVWSKTNAGMGSLYRSQHELLPLFKNGSAPHVNNVELGKRGRWRSNVWTYPGASSLGSDARRGLKDHPTASRLPQVGRSASHARAKRVQRHRALETGERLLLARATRQLLSARTGSGSKQRSRSSRPRRLYRSSGL